MTESDLRVRLENVRARVAAAARRAGRDPAGVTIVAVTKTVGPETVEALARLGHRDFGENRPADLVAKRAALEASGAAPGARWHMIGHFQTNKVRRTLASIDLVHSVDSPGLAARLSEECVRAGRAGLRVLVQCNVSGEATKGGFSGDDALAAVRHVASLPALRVEGLMTMAPACDDAEDVRPVFRRLREVGDAAAASGYLHGFVLSMGMSEDFEVAVEEGATIVRVGRALVGGAPARG